MYVKYVGLLVFSCVHFRVPLLDRVYRKPRGPQTKVLAVPLIVHRSHTARGAPLGDDSR